MKNKQCNLFSLLLDRCIWFIGLDSPKLLSLITMEGTTLCEGDKALALRILLQAAYSGIKWQLILECMSQRMPEMNAIREKICPISNIMIDIGGTTMSMRGYMCFISIISTHTFRLQHQQATRYMKRSTYLLVESQSLAATRNANEVTNQ